MTSAVIAFIIDAFALIQLVVLFPGSMLPFAPRSCAGNACLSIPRILGKALTSHREIHRSRSPLGNESPARGNCLLQEGEWVGKGGLRCSCALCLGSRQGLSCPGPPDVPGGGTDSNQGPLLLSLLPGAVSGSLIPLGRSQRTITRSMPRCEATVPTGATGTCSPPSS